MVEIENVIKYLLTSLYGVISILATIQFIRVKRTKPAERCRAPLHFFVIISTLVRCVEQVIPFTAYRTIRANYLWLQVLLDLFPELLFWQTFVMLVLLWVEMYTFARNKINVQVTIWTRLSLLTIFLIASCAAYLAAGAFAVVVSFTNHYNLLAEAIFLTILTASAMLVFLRYGYLTHKKLDRVPLFPPHRKTKRLNKLKFTVISVVVCNIIHIIYLYVVDVISRSKNVHTSHSLFLWIWMFYFVITEIIPSLIILLVFRKPPRSLSSRKRLSSPRSLFVSPSIHHYTPLINSAPSYADNYLPNIASSHSHSSSFVSSSSSSNSNSPPFSSASSLQSSSSLTSLPL